MKQKTFLVATAIVLLATAGIISCSGNKEEKDTVTDKTGFKYTTEQAKHGGYLVTISGCDDCHSPKVFGPHGPEIDSSKRLSGRPSSIPLPSIDTSILKSWMLFAPDITAVAGPWGVSFSANLTSDETGIGNWSLEQFTIAMRKGKFKGMENGRDLLPPMPWQNFKQLTDDDLRDIFAFLKSTKPVNNVVPAPISPTELK